MSEQGGVLVIDNYDSFTYNLVQMIEELGARTTVVRNDALRIEDAASMRPAAIVISPGPGTPEQAGICVGLVRALGAGTPILGVCLGHQAIGVAHGAEVVRVPPVHGKTAAVHHTSSGSFAGLPSPISAARYHSLAIDRATLPAELEVTAWSDDGVVMAVRHRTHPVEGFQFHPESILTDDGEALMSAFLARVVEHQPA